MATEWVRAGFNKQRGKFYVKARAGGCWFRVWDWLPAFVEDIGLNGCQIADECKRCLDATIAEAVAEDRKRLVEPARALAETVGRLVDAVGSDEPDTAPQTPGDKVRTQLGALRGFVRTTRREVREHRETSGFMMTYAECFNGIIRDAIIKVAEDHLEQAKTGEKVIKVVLGDIAAMEEEHKLGLTPEECCVDRQTLSSDGMGNAQAS